MLCPSCLTVVNQFSSSYKASSMAWGKQEELENNTYLQWKRKEREEKTDKEICTRD